jgi:site-specific DNA recombinase
MLQNSIYCGRIGHKEQSYEGMHDAITEPELWEGVQHSLAVNRRERRNGTSAKEPSLLAGLIFDAEGKRLPPSHAAKGGKRYRYYVSRSLITGPARTSESSWRLPAIELERLVVKQIGEFLCDPNRIWTLCNEAKFSHREAISALKRADKLAQALLRSPSSAERPLLLHLVKRIIVHADRIVMELSWVGLLEQLSGGRRQGRVPKRAKLRSGWLFPPSSGGAAVRCGL